MATTAEYGIGEFTYPRGWFMIAESALVDKKPQGIRFFGKDMVIYRGESGRVVVLDAYCPHMGTHLANNETSYVVLEGRHVEGDSIRCPYHGWRFNADGQCDEIPYSPAPIPKTACVKSWPIQEKAGIVFMWHDEEGGEPEYELPAFAQWDNPEWVRWKIDHLGVLNCHPQEIIDNMADKAHLSPIHGSTDMEYFENTFDKHVVFQHLAAGHKTLSEGMLYNETWYTGPGILQSEMKGDYPSLMLICHTPIDDGVVMAWHALMVKGANNPVTEADIAAGREYQESSRLAFMQDFEVWANKRPCFQVMQVIGDGPFGKVRIWYKQFFNPRAKAHEYQSQIDGRFETKGTAKHPWPQAAE